MKTIKKEYNLNQQLTNKVAGLNHVQALEILNLGRKIRAGYCLKMRQFITNDCMKLTLTEVRDDQGNIVDYIANGVYDIVYKKVLEVA